MTARAACSRSSGSTTAPVHGSRDVSPVLLRRIARDPDLTVHEFLARRR